ncbi:30S ribosomal protein S1 [Sporolactobacillus terrae]|uniref:30S ribosomal protein S1 n=1 Tax=Sporolactobacillus terrae TaxID=269673 RepID=A0ABX5Q7J1_9BACL|nr:30S ribosomal protein S1 [Sporolactobacillus terrae]QAA22626.1 30S ribosomal protein S1 [Sporolactobacillus terrae]QAA25600.1 30S ribosomal protein S1 [Sporolactobacillus terrae]UAK17408.1 30S ribosomal protein S1 [Sporolactobacillus terrae]
MVEEVNHDMAQFDALNVGTVVNGKVTKVEEKHALVDVGYKVDGILPISELSSLHVEKVADLLKEGDEISVKVTKLEDDELVLSKREVDADLAWDDLEDKFNNKTTFSVEIADVVKGGLVVDLGVRGFIPASLVERHFVEDFSDYKGKPLDVKIVELDREKRKVILSHRAVLDEAADKKKTATLESIQEGSVLEGTVQRLTDFGAFVDIGGVDGLVHISQLAHYHVEIPSEVVAEGDHVKVKVLAVDPENERISLSIKATQPGPWETAKSKINVGDVLEGTVKRLVPFGAFVELLPGVEGLVHISEISHEHIGTPEEVLTENQKIKVKVLDVNFDEQRVSLSIKALEEPQQEAKQEVQPEENPEIEEASTGFSLGDMIGDQLKKLK